MCESPREAQTHGRKIPNYDRWGDIWGNIEIVATWNVMIILIENDPRYLELLRSTREHNAFFFEATKNAQGRTRDDKFGVNCKPSDFLNVIPRPRGSNALGIALTAVSRIDMGMRDQLLSNTISGILMNKISTIYLILSI